RSCARLLRMTSLKWVSNTDMLSIGVKPSRFSSFTNASEIHTAFVPKAGSRTSSPGKWWNREIVRKFDVRDNKTILLREFPPHLGDPAYQLIMRNKQFCRELFAKTQLGSADFMDSLTDSRASRC